MVLEDLARQVVADWESGRLAGSITELSKHLDELNVDRGIYADQIDEAREQANEELEIDYPPFLSPADEGVWVSAWLWVAYPIVDDEIIRPLETDHQQ